MRLSMNSEMYSIYTGPSDMGRTIIVTHSINSGENCSIHLPYRHLPFTKQDVEQAEFQNMLDDNGIEPCQSSWASPVVLVTKIDGSSRFCMEYRKVNQVTCKDTYCLPMIANKFKVLGDA